MTEIEARALALVNEIERERGETELTPRIMRGLVIDEALCRTLEQHEAFKQEVSDAVEGYLDGPPIERHLIIDTLRNFIIIIPKPKPDPLVEIISEIEDGTYGETKDEYANKFRAALEARGLEIREKGQ